MKYNKLLKFKIQNISQEMLFGIKILLSLIRYFNEISVFILERYSSFIFLHYHYNIIYIISIFLQN